MNQSIITVTDKALERIKFLIEKRGKATLGIRVGVKSGGCSGLSYTIEYADQKNPFDEIIEAEGIKIIIDPKAVMYLIGCKMDFVEETLKSGFIFSNPNANATCGCGESFNA